jgi:S1-C subfamily serine protease
MMRMCVSVSCAIVIGIIVEPLFAAPPAKKVAERPRFEFKQAVDDNTVTELERTAMKSRTPRDALDLYQSFIARSELTPRQQEKIAERQKIWQSRIDRKLVRLGTEWVTLTEAKSVAKSADVLTLEAFEKIKAGDYKKARDLFEKATKQDPSGVRADYFIGMLCSPNLWNYAYGAEKHFDRARNRDPENVSIANNLAISKLKMGKYGDAVDLWSAALRIAPTAPEVVNNLGRFLKEDAAGRIPASEELGKRAKKLYEKALADKKGFAYESNRGWLYTPLTLSVDERERSDLLNILAGGEEKKEAPQAKPPANRTLAATGTGFVISAGYVLTNRHVAEDGSSFGVFQPQADAEHPATLVSIADDLDLALFRSESLQVPAVALNVEAPRRASEVMALGFPFGSALGATIKTVRGTVVGFENDAKRKTLLFEATVNPGNSGGPLCDNTGRVVAVVFAKLNFAAIKHGSGTFGMGIPIEAAMPFLRTTLPELQSAQPSDKLEWPEVDERISPSVVMVKTYVDALPFVDSAPTNKNANVFEDRTCTACKGRSVVLCPVKGCSRGSVADFEAAYTISGVGTGAQVLRWDQPKARTCPGCKGAGVVDCPHCKDGSDATLK